MALDPHELIACVANMTTAQRVRLCELLDPVARGSVKHNVEEMLQQFDKRIVAQGPLPDKPAIEPGVAVSLFRPPSPELLAQFLYKQMTGKKLEVIQLDDPTMIVVPDQPAIHDARPLNARARWQQLFGEREVPMTGSLDNEAELSLIEGMLYDKGVKNLDPARCTCGCGYVIGCGGTKGIHHIEG